MRPFLTFIFSVYNEEQKLKKSLQNIKSLANEIIIFDSGSKDKTVEIAKKFTPNVYLSPSPQDNVLSNYQYAINLAKGKWIFILKAGETLPLELVEEMKAKLNEDTVHSGYAIPTKHYFFNKWIKNGGYYPDLKTCLFLRERGRFDKSKINFNLSIKISGEVGNINNAIISEAPDNLEGILKEMENVITAYAKVYYDNKKKFNLAKIFFLFPAQFLINYFFKAGYKDGVYGFLLAILNVYKEILIQIKVWENWKRQL